jgi:hypothetical protein
MRKIYFNIFYNTRQLLKMQISSRVKNILQIILIKFFSEEIPFQSIEEVVLNHQVDALKENCLEGHHGQVFADHVQPEVY